jgi:hypothetical protein
MIVPEPVSVDIAEPAAEEPQPPETLADPIATPAPVEAEKGAAEEDEKAIPADSLNAIPANA